MLLLQIVFRTDASVEIGSGHVQRCLTLADQFRKAGAHCCFITREQPGNMTGMVEAKGYPIYMINSITTFSEQEDASSTQTIIESFSSNIDLLIVDHYELSKIWEEQVAVSVQYLMVIDDLANRAHYCHILLDQNYYKNYLERYTQLVPDDCLLLLGPKYLLLRPEFYQANKEIYKKTAAVNKLLIFYGGSDPTNETEKVLQALTEKGVEWNFQVDVVIGENNLNKERITQLCIETSANLHIQIDYMVRLIQQADFAFGAGGAAMWERGYLLLPSVVTIVADNQTQAVLDAEERGLIINLGFHDQVNIKDYINCLQKIVEQQIPIKQVKQELSYFFEQDKSEETSIAKQILRLISERREKE